MFDIKWSESRNFVRKIRSWKKDEIAMFAMKVVDAKDAKLKARFMGMSKNILVKSVTKDSS